MAEPTGGPVKQIILTDGAPRPSGAYSQAVRFGNLLFTAGIVANDPKTGQLVAPGDMAKQTEQVLENLKAILAAAGTSLENVLKVTAFISDIGQWSTFNEVYRRYFPTNPPARSTVEVGHFPPGIVVEIEMVAAIPD